MLNKNINIKVILLQLKMFYRTQRDLATAINKTVDAYWNDEIEEKQLVKTIRALHKNNPNKLLKEEKFTTVIQQHCGKRRLEVVKRILDINW
ncbi:hypothetical protein PB1_00040 [Bacillus methanolicus PB1]|uniref:Glycosyl transferase n=1 Tax=Bacillus methanolicus PB1 TaxID=997296 RepID=I3E470_BACMT|nr:TIGR04540 family protein [Bacillus methanolicus]EIJ81291.1 hypothetical protein PB1_00040 [Bacillus methanolicus PB1]